jgi:flagellar basal-body rod protein FlgC
MTIFQSIGAAQSGVAVYRKWMDAISDNIANLHTVRGTNESAYQAEYILAAPMEGGGAQVTGTALGSAEGRMVYEPNHPLADAQGYVRYPDIDLGDQMGQLIMAQRGYQANLSMAERAREAYSSALQIGRG